LIDKGKKSELWVISPFVAGSNSALLFTFLKDFQVVYVAGGEWCFVLSVGVWFVNRERSIVKLNT